MFTFHSQQETVLYSGRKLGLNVELLLFICIGFFLPLMEVVSFVTCVVLYNV